MHFTPTCQQRIAQNKKISGNPPKKGVLSGNMNEKRHTSKNSYWIYGTHAVRYALENPKRKILTLHVLNEGALGKLPPSKTSPKKVERTWFEQTFPKDAVHQGVAALVAPLPAFELEDLAAIDSGKSPNQTVIILDQVSDPHNVGAILRSAAVFDAQALIMTDRHAPPESATLAKAACGALEVVPIIRATNLAATIKSLREMGFWCYGFAESGAQTLDQVDFKGKCAIIVGAEGDGMRRLTKDLCDFLIRLETNPAFSTLNVSVAAAIALHQAFKSR